MQSTMTKGLFHMPALLPNKKIVSIDIGGTLAKVAFYIPRGDPKLRDPVYQEKLTKDTIPSKVMRVTWDVCSRATERGHHLSAVLPFS